MNAGIYSIGFKDKDCLYVGRAVNVYKRFSAHKCNLRRGVHHNRGLQNHYNKYGEDSLIFKMEKECSIEDLPQAECDIYKEKYLEGYDMLNAVGFVGQEVSISRNTINNITVYDQYNEQVIDWQTDFLRNILKYADNYDIESGLL